MTKGISVEDAKESNGDIKRISGGCVTKKKYKILPDEDFSKYVALDCEMVRTVTDNMALARCTILGWNGECIYDKYIKPQARIIDYVSRFSGIHPHHMETAFPFEIAQKQIKELLRDKVLIGHTTHSDLTAIKMSHPGDRVIDINKLPRLRTLLGKGSTGSAISLKRMSAALLNRVIQTGEHCSYEDSLATLDLFKVSLDPSSIGHKVVLPPAGKGGRKFFRRIPRLTVTFDEPSKNQTEKFEKPPWKLHRKQLKEFREEQAKIAALSKMQKANFKAPLTSRIERLQRRFLEKRSETFENNQATQKPKKSVVQPQMKPSTFLADEYWT